MRRFLIVLMLLALNQPASAHHTKEHTLAAPTPVPVPAETNAAESGGRPWLTLGPFFALAVLGIVRWRATHRRTKTRRGLKSDQSN